MKKGFKFFGICWLVAFILFNLITLVVPAEILDINRFEKPTFWVTYIFINLFFAAQLALGYVFCKNGTAEKMFLNIPVMRIGFTAVFFSLVVGVVFMVIPVIPTWIAIIACAIVTGCFVISGAKAVGAAAAVLAVEEKVASKSAFMNSITPKAEALVARAGELRSEAEKVFEAFKYSDVMSSAEASDVEEKINAHFVIFKGAVEAKDAEAAAAESAEILALVAERSAIVKATK